MASKSNAADGSGTAVVQAEMPVIDSISMR